MKNLYLLTFLLLPILLPAQLELVDDLGWDDHDIFAADDPAPPTAFLGDRLLTVMTTSSFAGDKLLLIRDSTTFRVSAEGLATAGDQIADFRRHGNDVYFTGRSATGGGSVWRTNGFSNGTELVFKPNSRGSGSSIRDYAFGADGAIYAAVRGDLLLRYAGDSLTQFPNRVDLTGGFGVIPGQVLAPYGEGVAYAAVGTPAWGGGLYLATDTIRRLAATSEHRFLGNTVAIHELNGNLVFSTSGGGQNGTFHYDAATDTITEYLDAAGDPILLWRYYAVADDLLLAFTREGGDFYLLDGDSAPRPILENQDITVDPFGDLPVLQTADHLFFRSLAGGAAGERVSVIDGRGENLATVAEVPEGGVLSNLVASDGYVFFSAQAGPATEVEFFRYDVSAATLTTLFTLPARASGDAYAVHFIGAVGDAVYVGLNPDDDQAGTELYRFSPGVDLTSVLSRHARPTLDVAWTSEAFTVRSTTFAPARLTVTDVNGRVLSRREVPVNTPVAIEPFSGLRIYVLERAGRYAVRKVVSAR